MGPPLALEPVYSGDGRIQEGLPELQPGSDQRLMQGTR